ncbi:MAG: DUF192 domain-containing protein [Vicinamibacterales bacterium]
MLVRLVNGTGLEVARVERATTAWTRARGLLGRPGLPPGQALWLAPCRSIHTVGMRFAIDVVFVDGDARVVKVTAAMVPWRLTWGGWRAHGAYEFAAGEAARLGIEVGQTLRVDVTPP